MLSRDAAASRPLIPIHQLSLYNTARMSPEQVIAAFAARQQQLDRIVADLAAETPKSPESAYRKAIACDPKLAGPWSGLGDLYCDHLNRFSDAADAYDNALRLGPTNDVVHQKRLFLRRDFMGEGASARPLMNELRADGGTGIGSSTATGARSAGLAPRQHCVCREAPDPVDPVCYMRMPA